MAFLFVTLNEIEHIRDESGKTITLRVKCTELAPRNFNVNLIKQPADRFNQINALIGKPVMMPIKEGITSDGLQYFQLEQGQIIPVDPNYGKTPQPEQRPVSSIPPKV
jgi:hypothetical protein